MNPSFVPCASVVIPAVKPEGWDLGWDSPTAKGPDPLRLAVSEGASALKTP